LKKEALNLNYIYTRTFNYVQQLSDYVSYTQSDTAFSLETSALMNVKADEFVVYLSVS